jgi:hypothetical protein
MAHEGITMAKAFGPFNGPPDASGLVQNVPALPGEQFEARAWMQAPSGDTIIGTSNFNTIALSFLNASGGVISTAAGPTNGKDFPVLDGRDPNIQADTWVEGVVNAVAPAGTAYVRVSLFFIQLMNQGGASWFDDVSLVRLTPDAAPGLAGDYNNDGVVDAVDYTVWRNNLNDLTEANINNNGDGGGVGPSDYTWWKQRYGNMAAGAGGITAVPEPSAMAVIGLGLIGALAVRRRWS